MSVYDNYEPVIGLEVHIQLKTNSKAYAADPVAYGEVPNTDVSPITLGHPGTLPMVNQRVVEFAVRLGLACNCNIRERNEYARKNYFYADLPKGYQITQDKTPICTGGRVEIRDKDGNPKFINLTRIHMEEDSGKSIHDIDPFHTLIDLNRAGTPLLEMVSEPDFKNGEEAYSYLSEVRKLVRYLDISDGNMEEGSLRCDVNISVRKKGVEKFGTKVEVKNMNSFRNVQKAIDFEIKRQVDLIESGGVVEQETRTFDAAKSATRLMRTKEDAHDYRYFPEPDLPPVLVKQDYIDEVRNHLPPLPNQLLEKYTKELNLSEYDARVITESKAEALYFEQLISHTKNFKAAANWMMGAVKNYLNSNAISMEDFPLGADKIAGLIALVDDNKVSNSIAAQRLFPMLIENPKEDAESLAKSHNLIQESDEGALMEMVNDVLSKFPEKVTEYQNGKKGLMGLFVGEVMKLSRGKADPKVTTKLIQEKLGI